MALNERVIIDRHDHVAHVRMVRTDRANSLDLQMFQALIAAGEEIIADPAIRAVILSGDGSGFCAGIDFAVLQAMQGGSIAGITDLSAPTHGICNLFQYAAFVWQKVPVPVIAAVPSNSRPVNISSRTRSGRARSRIYTIPPTSGIRPITTSLTANFASGVT